MQIQNIDGVICASYDAAKLQEERGVIEQIAEHTDNTWQPHRNTKEKIGNTEQGKIAERIVEKFIEQKLGRIIEIRSYDSIRCDNYEKHAPFDFLIWERGAVDIKPVVKAIQGDICASTGKNVRISADTRNLCRKNNVKIVEVKSTKIASRHKKGANFSGNYDDVEAVRRLVKTVVENDDFLCYPVYKRTEKRADYSAEDYCNEVKAQNPSFYPYEGRKLQDRILDYECARQLCDLFIRVYIDESAQRGFILGWMGKEKFYSGDVRLKRMVQKNKSEYALYWAKRLIYSNKMQTITQAVAAGRRVYASIYTKTEFYHRDRQCMYIRNLKNDEIKVFDMEDEALRGGRFTRRCFRCFGD